MRWLYLAIIPISLVAQTYSWPINSNLDHWINGTFCECRSSGAIERHHFHSGVDIHLPQGSAVYSVIDGTVKSIGLQSQYGINAYVRIGRYAYVHVDIAPGLAVGDSVWAHETVIGRTNSWNHIHFKDGDVGNERNPIRMGGGLSPVEDTYDPTVSSIDIFPVGKNAPTKDNRVFGRFDILVRAWDKTDTGQIGSNNGVQSIGFSIVDEDGNIVVTREPFSFDYLPSSSNYITNVYAPGSNTSVYIYTVTNSITADSYLDVSDWPRALYNLNVFTADPYGYVDTLSRVIEVVDEDNTAPAPPQFLMALPKDNGFELQWASNTEADLAGYRLYFSFDGISWSNTANQRELSAAVTSFIAPVISLDNNIYFYLTAVDDSPAANESEPSTTFGLRNSPSLPEILIIDSNSEASEAHNQWPLSIGHHFHMGYGMVHEDLFASDTLDLGRFDASIIHDGNDTQPLDSTFSSQYLASALMERQRWYMGTRILATWPTSDSLWRTELQLDPQAISTVSTDLIYRGETIFGLPISQGLWLADSIISGSLPDSLQSEMAMQIHDWDGNIYGYSRDGEVTITLLPLESLGDAATQALIALPFRQDMGVLATSSTSTVDQFLLRTYPNPFNSAAAISFTLPKPGPLKLVVINLRGRVIATLLDDFMDAGVHRFRWKPDGIASGIYFLRMAYSDQVITHRITQIK